MTERALKTVFPILITVTLFSLWAGFALTIVNPFFHKDVVGYRIGRICIWELVAFGISVIISRRLIRKWGNLDVVDIGNKPMIVMNPKFGIYFGIYFLLAILVGVWQFWVFSQQF